MNILVTLSYTPIRRSYKHVRGGTIPNLLELRKAEVQVEKHGLLKVRLLKEKAMYSCSRTYSAWPNSECLAKLGLQYGCCDLGCEAFLSDLRFTCKS
jgi:hypothetical protein